VKTGWLKIFLRLVLFAIKTGQWQNAIRLVAWAIQAKISYDEAMARLDESYYEKQVVKAANNFHRHYKCDTSKVPGMDRWLKEQNNQGR